ncbi:unnamed protein product [Larinioides sclopetarius]|uniref:Uncharacterized protein n=1 Tax=Larinioides sclopetarius TaxID=280406 RepID=A0AAV2AVF9_9ARAC
MTSPSISTWESIMFLDSTDSEDDTIPVHSDLLEVAITIQGRQEISHIPWAHFTSLLEIIRIKAIGRRDKNFCSIFGKESSEDFLSQLTRMFDDLVKVYGFYSSSIKNLSSFCLNSTLTETLILNKPREKN